MKINKRKLFEIQPKQPKGITLIALIITVIVMLILAGVSINALVGDNGVLKQGQNAKEKHAIETYRERIGISVVGAKANLIEEPIEFFETVRGELKTQAEFKGASYNIKDNNRLIITTKEGYRFVVEYPKGTVKYLGKEETPEIIIVETDIEVTKSTNNWTKDKVKVTISCAKYPLCKIEYSYDLNEWKPYEGEFEVKENTEIYVRLVDDFNVTEHFSVATISNIDKKAPDIITDIAVKENSITTQGFEVVFSAQDTDTNVNNASGLGKVIWYYKKSTETVYNVYGQEEILHTMPNSTPGSRNIEELSKVFNGLVEDTEYSIYAEIYDVAENKLIVPANGNTTNPLKIKTSDIKVNNVTLNPTSKMIIVGGQFTIGATVNPNTANNQELEWTSSNENVATVSNGVVTTIEVGTTTITAKTKDGSNKTGQCSVTVVAQLTGLKLGTEILTETGSNTPVVIGYSASRQLGDIKASTENTEPLKNISYTSDDTSVVSVSGTSSSGIVTISATGNAGVEEDVETTITISATGSLSNKTLIRKYKLKVKGKFPYLVNKVKIGDYVDIEIPYATSYTNSVSFDGRESGVIYTTTAEALTGWRVIDVSGNTSNDTVTLISSGCPLTYIHQVNARRFTRKIG